MIPARWKLYAVIVVAFVLGVVGVRSRLLSEGEDRLRAKIEKDRVASRQAAQEIENEVDALDRDALKRRGSVWVRKTKR